MTRPESLPDYRWQVSPTLPASFQQQFSHLHPILLQVLYNRGITDAAHMQAFLEGRYLESQDPFLLAGMDKAVARIQQAIENEERIIVYGDFDADGVTATVLLTQALRGLGLNREQVQPYIPDRVDEGYGLNIDALTRLRQEKGASLVITVDCGIRSLQEVKQGNELGLEMIVTDHHSLGAHLPPALAVINPKRPDCRYPDKMLAGVGLAFKLAQALRQAMPRRARYEDEDLLDLVAIGTVADLAPLLHENRKLVIEGLKVLNKLQRPGLEALAKVAGIQPGNLTAESIGFVLGPRLNAAGRLSHAYDAARLLVVNNTLEAERYAADLDKLNQERQRLTRNLTELAETMVRPEDPILIVAHERFVSGVVGLVASQLAEKYYRPAVVIEQGETVSHGSCRSIPELHITEALDQVADLLERHGGHAQAAGLTIRNEQLPAFRQRLSQVVQERLGGLELRPSLPIDMEIPLRQVDWALQGVLDQLEPTGSANATPLFASRHVQVLQQRPVGGNSHLKLLLGDGLRGVQAIAFRQGAWADRLPRLVDVAYTIGVNDFRGRRDLQVVVQDIREPGGD